MVTFKSPQCYDEGKRTAETLTMDYHRGSFLEGFKKEEWE
jgi:hypothetical protein